MTQDEIIEMAVQAGIARVVAEVNIDIMKTFANLVAAKERAPQRTWVGLTDEEKEKFVVAYYPSTWDRKTAVALMNNYEAYLKEKNT